MQESRNFVITDETLQVAAEEVAMAMLNNIPEETYSFSARFEKKMQRLLRRAKHPVFYQVMRYAAVIVLAVTVLFGAVFAVSPTVRAAVIGWVQSVFHEFYKYSSEETTPPDVEYEYYLPESFDDYSLLTTLDDQNGKTYVYTNKQGQIMQFSYSHASNGENLYVNAEDYEVFADLVGNNPADIYISKTDERENVIIWQDNSQNVLFTISGFVNHEELLEIAKRVEKISK